MVARIAVISPDICSLPHSCSTSQRIVLIWVFVGVNCATSPLLDREANWEGNLPALVVVNVTRQGRFDIFQKVKMLLLVLQCHVELLERNQMLRVLTLLKCFDII